MITNLLIGLITTIVNALDALLPHFTVPSFMTSGSLIPTGAVDFIAALFSAVSSFYPSQLVLSIFVSICAMWPVVGAYLVFQWVWRHVPTIAGFGTGDG
jgi:hypothetical protein